MKCHAVEVCGVLHSLKPYRWPPDDHRQAYKFAAYADGAFWRFFKTVRDWKQAAERYRNTYQRGPYAQATDRAVCWSEFEGRRILDRVFGEDGPKSVL